MGGLALLAVGLLAGLIFGSASVALRGSRPRMRASLGALGAPSKLLVLLALGSLLIVQALGAADAYLQTHVLHESTHEYFQSLSRARLLGMSHSHMFGYLLCYGFFAWVFLRTSFTETTKCLVVAALGWAGPFDVLSWWGIRELSSRFELLSITTGALSSSLSLFIAVVATREVFRSRMASRPTTPAAVARCATREEP